MILLVQDSLRAALTHPVDAARPDSIHSPLPGGIATVVRFIFNVPQWIQIGGFFLGVAVAIGLVIWAWRSRDRIAGWVKTRERGVQLGMAGGLFAFVLVAGGSGAASWNYMQHDNGFCTGCHVMTKPFGLFQARAGKHDSLECHACHQQSIYASMRQLVLWVAERPEKIGKHAKVPSAICASCHVDNPRQKEKWQRIATTAGHRVHLESDSLALKNVQCVTCHGLETHKFVPVSKTCQQEGCHEKVEIKLGKMAQQTSLHCVTCHQFTADVPRLATRDSASGTLVPTNKQCLSCHEMRKVIEGFDPDLDPHKGTCGMCHNPHKQATSKEAAKSCTTAGCHDNWRNNPFHVGVAHRKVGESCQVCHAPHAAKVDPSDCQSCHERVRKAAASGAAGRRLAPPLPFDTLKAKRTASDGRSAEGPVPVVYGFLGWGWPTPPPRPVVRSAAPAADSFPHPRHKKLACLTCHTSNLGHGRLTFEKPRGGLICQHQNPKTTDCATCHRPADLAKAIQAAVTVTVPKRAARTRAVGFVHAAHKAVTCVTCHAESITMVADSVTRTCQSCHEDHHKGAANCSTCHTGQDLTPAHARPVDTHQRCDACHREQTVAQLIPGRALCLTCHAAQDRHYVAKECTVCHFQASPGAYRAHLVTPKEPER